MSGRDVFRVSPAQRANAVKNSAASARGHRPKPVEFDVDRALDGLKAILEEVYGRSAQ